MQKDYYNKFFQTYGPDVHHDPIRFSEIANLCKGNVLDIGCGTGDLSDYYHGPYCGLDISQTAINMAKELRRKDAKFFVHDCCDLYDFDLNNFDTIVLAEFLEHIENDDAIFDAISKKAKNGTRLIITCPNGSRVPDASHVREFTIPVLRKKFSELGKIKFYNWPGSKERILLTVDLGEKNDNLLSLVIIAKNEELGLENSVLSAINFVDNVVIAVDDSSIDNTLSIAKMYADDLRLYKWEGSFCKARNLAQANIKTKWVLHLDGHEYVEQIGNLYDALNTDFDSLFVKIILENDFSFFFPRIVRNFVKWERDVHNYPVIKDNRTIPSFIIRHDRANLQSEQSKKIRDQQRTQMVIDIMTAALKKNKKDIRALFYLAQQYHFQKDFEKALKYYKKYLKYSKNKQERWLVYWDMATIYNLTGRYLRALLKLYRSEKELPERWETRFALGITWGLIGHAKLSAGYFVDSMLPNKEIYMYNPLIRDEAQIWDFLGMAFFDQGKKYEAKVAWKRALEVEKSKDKKDILQQRIEILKRLTDD